MNTVEKIHHEIDTASENLLNYTRSILESTKLKKYDSEKKSKAERLIKLGFTQSEEVKEYKKILDENLSTTSTIKEHKTLADLITYYQETYPFFKFLTTNQLNAICNKYKLIYAPVENYTKNIPNKNLLELENAQEIKTEDIEGILYELNGGADFQKFMSSIGYPDMVIPQSDYQDLLKSAYGYVPPDWTNLNSTGLFVIWQKLGEIGSYNFDSISEINKSGLFIAAPKSHFNLKTLLKRGKGFFKILTTKIEPKDPIVFKYVKGGILVITKWGLEAEDTELIIPITN